MKKSYSHTVLNFLNSPWFFLKSIFYQNYRPVFCYIYLLKKLLVKKLNEYDFIKELFSLKFLKLLIQCLVIIKNSILSFNIVTNYKKIGHTNHIKFDSFCKFYILM